MEENQPQYQINPEIFNKISDLIEKDDDYQIRQILSGFHAADLADILGNLKMKYRSYVFELLDSDIASEVISELDQSSLEIVLGSLDEIRISEIVDEMDSDDATDIISELSEDIAEKVLDTIDEEDSLEVKELLRYDEDTAGGIMQLEFVSVMDFRTIGEAIQKIRRMADEVAEIYYLYITNKQGVLVGFVDLKDLIINIPSMPISQVMEKEIFSAHVDMDQEEVARLFEKYDLLSVPVVGRQNKLIGIITIDDILDVIEEEAAEDISRMAGIADEEEIFEDSAIKISRARLPWLIIGLFGGLFSALVLSHFESSLDKIITLAFFVPVMIAMGGNIGIQSSAIIVRGLATGDLDISHTWRRLFKEFRVALINGIICAIVLICIVYIWIPQLYFALLIGISLLFIILLAAIIGATVPFLLKRFGIDPALATGPFVTTSNDILGLFIYLGLATLFLNQFK